MVSSVRLNPDGHRKLVVIKLLHSLAWMFFVGCIVGIPIAAMLHAFRWAEILAGCMFVECGILAVNKGRCPFTDLASRYTNDRAANFDIYLPEWLARHNKFVFGTLFIADLLLLAWRFA